MVWHTGSILTLKGFIITNFLKFSKVLITYESAQTAQIALVYKHILCNAENNLLLCLYTLDIKTYTWPIFRYKDICLFVRRYGKSDLNSHKKRFHLNIESQDCIEGKNTSDTCDDLKSDIGDNESHNKCVNDLNETLNDIDNRLPIAYQLSDNREVVSNDLSGIWISIELWD